MGLVIIKAKARVRKSQKGHSKSLPVTLNLEQPGRLRIGHLQTLYSVSHSTIYNRIEKDLIPKPDGKDGARPYWNTLTIKTHLQGKAS